MFILIPDHVIPGTYLARAYPGICFRGCLSFFFHVSCVLLSDSFGIILIGVMSPVLARGRAGCVPSSVFFRARLIIDDAMEQDS